MKYDRETQRMIRRLQRALWVVGRDRRRMMRRLRLLGYRSFTQMKKTIKTYEEAIHNADPVNHRTDWPERAELDLLRAAESLWLELASTEIRIRVSMHMMKEGL